MNHIVSIHHPFESPACEFKVVVRTGCDQNGNGGRERVLGVFIARTITRIGAYHSAELVDLRQHMMVFVIKWFSRGGNDSNTLLVYQNDNTPERHTCFGSELVFPEPFLWLPWYYPWRRHRRFKRFEFFAHNDRRAFLVLDKCVTFNRDTALIVGSFLYLS